MQAGGTLIERNVKWLCLYVVPVLQGRGSRIGASRNINTFVVYWATKYARRADACLAVFAVEYLLTSIAARLSGIRFVTNVLAVHSSGKKVALNDAGGDEGRNFSRCSIELAHGVMT